MRVPALLIAVAVALSLVLGGCGDAKSAGPSTDQTTTTDTEVDLSKEVFVDDTDQDRVEVDAVDNNFRDRYITVKAGTTVVFKNDGRNQHNVLPVLPGAFEKAETDEFEPGTSYEVTFDEVGDDPYYCSLHGTTTKGMTGAVRVVK